ncbi:MAG: DUF1349 domain-containing protein [Eubacterium sp.]|nr:DUF1349 domain-containing protein [Eubacterium sp.]
MKFNVKDLQWVRQPKAFTVDDSRIEITTEPDTDLWQRTFYHFTGDNAPVLQMETEEKSFSFTVKTEFPQVRKKFDQCGIAVYLDSDNWMKASAEYADENGQHFGSVLTNHGYCDWATNMISSEITTVWYRLSRKDADYVIEYSFDGETYHMMRMFHMFEGDGKIRFGIYACSPGESSFKAVFSEMAVTEFLFED